MLIMFFCILTYRETFVRLTCDKDVKKPIVTTEGDFGHYFSYVRMYTKFCTA